ncbi:hypothetical protein EVG20_g3296 [Dentipellis fragilis]|uniref:Protein kinase domain-containing protein n=1 Tax=Dentipellis fragilis TaxID=205917 RepID=A0A4Y9Z2P5_9AGAM|nr:hypothetical protein EVG20_g3296 [Dentipellis fragilis]
MKQRREDEKPWGTTCLANLQRRLEKNRLDRLSFEVDWLPSLQFAVTGQVDTAFEFNISSFELKVSPRHPPQPTTSSSNAAMATSSPCSTPVRKQSRAVAPLVDTNTIKAKPRYLEFCKDMEKQFVGPMPAKAFLDTFVPKAPTPCPSVGKHFQKLDPTFKGRGKKGKGRKTKKQVFEDAFIGAVKASGLCPDLELFNTTSRSSDQYVYDQKPDISVCDDRRASEDPPTSSPAVPDDDGDADYRPNGTVKSHAVDWYRMELCIECKTHEQDPFSDPPANTTYDRDAFSFEKFSSIESMEARGQLISYASAHMSLQFRCFCFSVCLIDQKDARLIRWDRSGAIVSERFDMTKDGNALVEFLWRFNHLSYAQRGHDPSVTVASSAEKALAEKHAMMGDIHKVLVVNDVDKAKRYFLISAPTEYKLVVTGRASFGDIALDMETETQVWLKDSWRIDLDEMEKECDIYRKLRANNVRNIAELVCGGDVVGGAGQKTVTQDYADASWRHGEVALLPHRHYRLALKTIGHPLKTFGSTKELVQVVYDALIAHWDAFSLAGILHRDISGGNILIVKDGGATRGILIDWDLSKETDALEKARRKWRTGTWRFISAAILKKKDKVHKYWDDLESFDHVITYHILRYRPWNLPSYRHHMDQIYDSTEPQENGNEVLGGSGKESFFGYSLFRPREIKAVMPSHLAGLIQELRRPFHLFYGDRDELGSEYCEKKKAEKQVKSAAHYLDVLERYLAMDCWGRTTAAKTSSEKRRPPRCRWERRGRQISATVILCRGS